MTRTEFPANFTHRPAADRHNPAAFFSVRPSKRQP
jgi:hypothetical protein